MVGSELPCLKVSSSTWSCTRRNLSYCESAHVLQFLYRGTAHVSRLVVAVRGAYTTPRCVWKRGTLSRFLSVCQLICKELMLF